MTVSHYGVINLLMIWQGYFDESEKDDWFVIAGYLGRVDRWAVFSAEWASMARKYGRIDSAGKWHIHMSEHQHSDMPERLPALRRTINDHALMGLAVAMRPTDFRKSVDRLVGFRAGRFIPVKGNLLKNYYLFAFELFLDCFSHRTVEGVHNLHQIDLKKDRIELIFDERAEKRIICNAWEGFVGCRKKHSLPNVIGAKPEFKDDKFSLPLQAADFLERIPFSLGHSRMS